MSGFPHLPGGAPAYPYDPQPPYQSQPQPTLNYGQPLPNYHHHHYGYPAPPPPPYLYQLQPPPNYHPYYGIPAPPPPPAQPHLPYTAHNFTRGPRPQQSLSIPARPPKVEVSDLPPNLQQLYHVAIAESDPLLKEGLKKDLRQKKATWIAQGASASIQASLYTQAVGNLEPSQPHAAPTQGDNQQPHTSNLNIDLGDERLTISTQQSQPRTPIALQTPTNRAHDEELNTYSSSSRSTYAAPLRILLRRNAAHNLRHEDDIRRNPRI